MNAANSSQTSPGWAWNFHLSEIPLPSIFLHLFTTTTDGQQQQDTEEKMMVAGGGIALALIASLSNSVTDVLRKQLTHLKLHPMELVAYRGIITVPMLFVLTLFEQPRKPLLNNHNSLIPVVAVLMSSLINFVTSLMMFHALTLAPLSMTVPFLSVTPACLLITGYLMLGELPTFLALVGVIVIVSTTYMISKEEDKYIKSDDHELKTGKVPQSVVIKHKRGMMYMLTVAVLWSLSSVFDKIGAKAIGEQTYGFYVQALITIPALVCSLFCGTGLRSTSSDDLELSNLIRTFSRKNLASGTTKLKLIFTSSNAVLSLFLCSLVGTFTYYVHLQSLLFVDVSYVIALKRAGCLVTILLSKVLYPQEEVSLGWRRLGLVAAMVAGVFLIVFYH